MVRLRSLLIIIPVTNVCRSHLIIVTMNTECNPIWQDCTITAATTQAPPKLDSVLSSIRDFVSSSPSTCSPTGYPIWLMFIIWLTTETGVVIIDWIIHQIRIRRIMEIPEFINRLPPSGKLILLILISIQHLIYYFVSICAIVRTIHRERQQETVPMDPYEHV